MWNVYIGEWISRIFKKLMGKYDCEILLVANSYLSWLVKKCKKEINALHKAKSD